MKFKNLRVGDVFTFEGGVFKRVKTFKENDETLQVLVIDPIAPSFLKMGEFPIPSGGYSSFYPETEVVRLKDYVEKM